MNGIVFVILLCVGVVWFLANRGRFGVGGSTARGRTETGAKAAWVEAQMAWTDGKGHYYDTLPGLVGFHDPPGWTVIIHERTSGGTIGAMMYFAGQYATEKEAWAAAQQLAERSVAGEQEH